MDINWFPGHMVKTKRDIVTSLKFCDAVIEIRDARIVSSSKNPDIGELCKGKPKVILLNKFDLAEDKITNEWCEKLTTENVRVLKVNSITGEGLNKINDELKKLLAEKLERYETKGLKRYLIRAMVVGIPNVGKSSFINKMAKNPIAKVGNRPGVTKNKQWIKTSYDLELLDTPGVLWPKLGDEKVGMNLAFTGAIKDEIMDIETLGLRLIEKLQLDYEKELISRYKIDSVDLEDAVNTMDKIAKKRGAIMKGGMIDYERTANLVLDEFRKGIIGKISLERQDYFEKQDILEGKDTNE